MGTKRQGGPQRMTRRMAGTANDRDSRSVALDPRAQAASAATECAVQP